MFYVKKKMSVTKFCKITLIDVSATIEVSHGVADFKNLFQTLLHQIFLKFKASLVDLNYE